jgi:hypothetical protein
MVCLPGPKVRSRRSAVLPRHVEQRAFASGLVVGDRRLVEVAEVVELVAVDLLELPALLTGPLVRADRVDRARRVQVAVGSCAAAILATSESRKASSLGSGLTLSV